MTPDKELSVNTARCLGSCGLAPVAVLDGNVLGRALPEMVLAQVRAAIAAGPVQDTIGEVAEIAPATIGPSPISPSPISPSPISEEEA